MEYREAAGKRHSPYHSFLEAIRNKSARAEVDSVVEEWEDCAVRGKVTPAKN